MQNIHKSNKSADSNGPPWFRKVPRKFQKGDQNDLFLPKKKIKRRPIFRERVTHGLLETRPDILPTENRVGELWTYVDNVTLFTAFIGIPRMHDDDWTLFGKLLGEIWTFLTFFFQ